MIDRRFETKICPHCKTEIYVWYVFEHGSCPPDACGKPLTIEQIGADPKVWKHKEQIA